MLSWRGLIPQQDFPEGQTWESSPVKILPAPIPKELKELGVPPISQEADELDAAEEPTDELAILTATVRKPAKEPDTPLCSRGGRKEEGSK